MKRFRFREFYFGVIFFVIFCFGEANLAFSEMVVLKNGSTVEGKIIKKTDKDIVVDLFGVELTYDMGDIKTIDGNVPVSTDKQAASLNDSIWDNWYLGKVKDYIKNIADIAHKFRDMVEKQQKEPSLVGEGTFDGGRSLLERAVALKPPAELELFHEKFVESAKEAVVATEKIRGGDLAAGKTYQRKSFELMISWMQELRRVYELHKAPKDFIAEIDKGNSFADQQLQKL